MNRIYRLIFNHALGFIQVVPETARGSGKSGTIRKTGMRALSLVTLMFASGTVLAEDDIIEGGQTVNVMNEMRTVDGDLYVGGLGEGRLIIGEGGVVENINGYIGRFGRSSGAVFVAGEGAQWINSGSLTIGAQGNGTLTLSNQGHATASLLRMGTMSSGSGRLIIGADTSQAAVAPGVLGVNRIETGQGASQIVFNHTDTSGNYAFTPDITGNIELAHYRGTTRLTGDNSYTESTVFEGGTLILGNDNALGTGTLVVTGASQEGRPTLQSGESSLKISNDVLFARPRDLPFSNQLTIQGSNNLELAGQLFGSDSGPVYLSKSGSGTLTLSGDNSNNLNVSIYSGTLHAAHNHALGRDTYLHEGTLDYADDIELNTRIHIFPSMDGSATLHVREGAFATQSGQIISVSNVYKTGLGTLKLLGNHPFHQKATVVNEGTLLVEGSIAQSERVTVNSGATLSGSGTVGNTVIEDGGTLAPGGNVMGTLSVDGDLTLSSGSILQYTLGSPGTLSDPLSGRSDRIDVSGDLVLDGTLNLVQSSDVGDGVAGLGYYRLITYGGELTDKGLNVGNSPNVDAGYEIQAGANRVDLFIGVAGNDDLQHWQGGDGVWNATNTQWLNQDGETAVTWAGNHAAFKNQPGNFDGGIVDIEAMQHFSGLQFVDEGYRLQGMGSLVTKPDNGSEIRVFAERAEIATQITGAGGITKTGAGTLILSGNNTHAGGTTLAGGVVSVSSDAHLGHQDSPLVFDGGILQVTGTDFNETDRQLIWGAGGGGFNIIDESNNFHIGQNITGSGDLVKGGKGVLTLAGKNAYGNTLVEDGWLLGNTGSISGSVANAAVVAFVEEKDTHFAGDIIGLGGINGIMVKDGAGKLTLEGRSLLDWSIASGALVTEASRFKGNAHLDQITSELVFTDAKSGVYGGSISGIGQFKLDGSGSVLLTGDSLGFTGNTEVHAGTLLVGDADGDGALGGSLNVLAGASLSGSGTVGSGSGSEVAIISGGTLGPGNSVGTLTIDGDLIFEAGSRFEVEVDPQGIRSDRVNVTGHAMLNGGSVVHIGADGNYDLHSAYTILAADGKLSGAFDEVSSDFAFLTPGLTYDYGLGTVNLSLSRNKRDFISAALTHNQRATADGVESIGLLSKHAVYDAIVQLTNDDKLIRTSFDALSGEIHASTKTAFIEESRFIRNAATERLRAAFAAPSASNAAVPAGGQRRAFATHNGPAVWSQALGSWGKTDSDGNAASLNRNTSGLLVGADRLIGDWRLGALAGYSHSDFKARGRSAWGKSDNYHLGVYAGTQWDALGLRMGLAYTWHNINMRRSAVIPGLNGDPRASYRASTGQVFGELGYGIDVGAARFEPFVNLAHVRLHTDKYRESGSVAALSGVSDKTDATFTTLGLRLEHAFNVGAAVTTMRGAVGWRYAFGDTTPTAHHRFSAGDAFTVAGVPIAKNSAVLEAGIDLSLKSSAIFGLSYAGQLSGSARDHSLRANMMIRF